MRTSAARSQLVRAIRRIHVHQHRASPGPWQAADRYPFHAVARPNSHAVARPNAKSPQSARRALCVILQFAIRKPQALMAGDHRVAGWIACAESASAWPMVFSKAAKRGRARNFSRQGLYLNVCVRGRERIEPGGRRNGAHERT